MGTVDESQQAALPADLLMVCCVPRLQAVAKLVQPLNVSKRLPKANSCHTAIVREHRHSCTGRLCRCPCPPHWLCTSQQSVAYTHQRLQLVLQVLLMPAGPPRSASRVQTVFPLCLQLVPILRAGLVLLEQTSTLLPAQQTYHVGLVRNEETLQARFLAQQPLLGTSGPTDSLFDASVVQITK